MTYSTLPDVNFKASPAGQVSVDDAKGIVECFVAAIGNKDSVGDIIVPGAFDASLKRRKPRVVWGHNWNEPIGKVLEIVEVGPTDPRLPMKMRQAGVGGLFARVQFNLKSERGREAFSNVSFFGEEQEWSIGYKTLNGDFDPQKQANILKEVELYEVSPVLHGANQLTGTISIKSANGEDAVTSFGKSQWKMFDRAFAERIKADHPEIWDAGGNIKGDDQYTILTKIAEQGGTAKTPDQVKALELREAWVARHKDDFRLPGVIAQIKWLAIGSRGEPHMKKVVNDAIADRREEKGAYKQPSPEKLDMIVAALTKKVGGNPKVLEIRDTHIDFSKDGKRWTIPWADLAAGHIVFAEPEETPSDDESAQYVGDGKNITSGTAGFPSRMGRVERDQTPPPPEFDGGANGTVKHLDSEAFSRVDHGVEDHTEPDGRNNHGAIYLMPESAKGLTVTGGLPGNYVGLPVKTLGPTADWTEDEQEKLKQILTKWVGTLPGAMTGNVTGVGNMGRNMVAYHVDVPGLSRARAALSDTVDLGTTPDTSDATDAFVPHMPVGYGVPHPEVPAQPVTFNRVRLMWSPEHHEDFPLPGVTLPKPGGCGCGCGCGAKDADDDVQLKVSLTDVPGAESNSNIGGEILHGYGPHRGNLDKLIRYWRPIMKKKGGFRRCVAELMDHPELAPWKPLCAWLHHEITGLWPNEGHHHDRGREAVRDVRRALKGRKSAWSEEYGIHVKSDMVLDEDDDMFDDDDRAHAIGVLKKFCAAEPDFVAYVQHPDSWHIVDGDGKTSAMDDWHEWIADTKCTDCDEKAALDDGTDLAQVMEIANEVADKVGRKISSANMAKLQQALQLLNEVVGVAGIEAKGEYVVLDTTPREMFALKSLLDPVAEFYGTEILVDEADGETLTLQVKSAEQADAVGRALSFHEGGVFGVKSLGESLGGRARRAVSRAVGKIPRNGDGDEFIDADLDGEDDDPIPQAAEAAVRGAGRTRERFAPGSLETSPPRLSADPYEGIEERARMRDVVRGGPKRSTVLSNGREITDDAGALALRKPRSRQEIEDEIAKTESWAWEPPGRRDDGIIGSMGVQPGARESILDRLYDEWEEVTGKPHPNKGKTSMDRALDKLTPKQRRELETLKEPKPRLGKPEEGPRPRMMGGGAKPDIRPSWNRSERHWENRDTGKKLTDDEIDALELEPTPREQALKLQKEIMDGKREPAKPMDGDPTTYVDADGTEWYWFSEGGSHGWSNGEEDYTEGSGPNAHGLPPFPGGEEGGKRTPGVAEPRKIDTDQWIGSDGSTYNFDPDEGRWYDVYGDDKPLSPQAAKKVGLPASKKRSANNDGMSFMEQGDDSSIDVPDDIEPRHADIYRDLVRRGMDPDSDEFMDEFDQQAERIDRRMRDRDQRAARRRAEESARAPRGTSDGEDAVAQDTTPSERPQPPRRAPRRRRAGEPEGRSELGPQQSGSAPELGKGEAAMRKRRAELNARRSDPDLSPAERTEIGVELNRLNERLDDIERQKRQGVVTRRAPEAAGEGRSRDQLESMMQSLIDEENGKRRATNPGVRIVDGDGMVEEPSTPNERPEVPKGPRPIQGDPSFREDPETGKKYSWNPASQTWEQLVTDRQGRQDRIPVQNPASVGLPRSPRADQQGGPQGVRGDVGAVADADEGRQGGGWN